MILFLGGAWGFSLRSFKVFQEGRQKAVMYFLEDG